MIKYILWDIDGTLLNFSMAESNAMRACFAEYNLGELSDDRLEVYKNINDKYWKRLERGEISRIEVLEGRFKEFFSQYGYNTDVVSDFNISYQENLGKTYVFNDNAYETVIKLNNKYSQYAATNGSIIAQKGKLKGAGLDGVLKDVFISELIGYEKPSEKFFSYIFDSIGSYKREEYVIIGDSLTSDMAGGNRAGIKTIWFNPDGLSNPNNVDYDYEIKNLSEVLNIL
ncbi:YjjG family noncanonical pyrimidine nucleotidase [Anaerococcus prevotii]|uniref:HAD hydrolase, TIGR02254 family n=1 Tax=Anaerococcus prevotii ACS-065-V-Col13 TaxID=879305 RepID=F0GUP3_9FIRM|nr:YjjG family noncanonical pyrimidine nucleotidase [Anaerococcus prevotii]EGC82398.1 HAD hydrolase, TIGR02254 family [Anaerococcus prevotii ACS-065-V-Col13]